MHRPILLRLATTTLLGLTLLGGVAEAKKPKTPAPPVQASVLTFEEQQCEALGYIVAKQAEARDAGVPYLTLVTALRRLQAQASPGGAWIAQASLTMLPAVYQATLFTPQQLRQRTELGCLKHATPDPKESSNTRY
jgi:hypothetical protein